VVAVRRGCKLQTDGVGPRARNGEGIAKDAEGATVILTIVAGLHGSVKGVIAAVRADIREYFQAVASVAAKPDAAVELWKRKHIGWRRERISVKNDPYVSAEGGHGLGVELGGGEVRRGQPSGLDATRSRDASGVRPLAALVAGSVREM
jgi:hypothetical protein